MSKETEQVLRQLVLVTDAWLDHAIYVHAMTVIALGVDTEILSALLELRVRRRVTPGAGEKGGA